MLTIEFIPWANRSIFLSLEVLIMTYAWLQAISLLVNERRPERSQFWSNGELMAEGTDAPAVFARMHNSLKASGHLASSVILFAEDGFGTGDAADESRRSNCERFFTGDETHFENASTVNEWLVK